MALGTQTKAAPMTVRWKPGTAFHVRQCCIIDRADPTVRSLRYRYETTSSARQPKLPMNAQGQAILAHLETVAAERRSRAADALLAERVRDIKRLQHARFERSYADLLAQPRYAKSARFFLEELYGPADFSARDGQFARVVPAMVRMFPQEIVCTVANLAELHALSEVLDTAMGWAIAAPARALGADLYGQAWREVGRAPDRERQIALMLAVGSDLERYTGRALLRHSLRLMRGPATAAGLGSLQRFLETGFDTFREMRGAELFLRTIAERERALAAQLFCANATPPQSETPSA